MREDILGDRKLKPIVGIIIPSYNEEDTLFDTRNELLKILRILENNGTISPQSFIAFVDDGSTDRTWEIILKLHKETPGKIKGLKLSRNFGHQNALLAGMLTFHHDLCITIDADLQDSPSVIIDMIEKYKQGYEIVYGVRIERKFDNFFKRSTAQLFYKLMKILGVKIVNNHADFRLLTKRVIDKLKEFREVNIFLRGIIPYLGFNSGIVHYRRSPRKAGKTKYSLKKMLHLAWEGVTSFSIVPLRIISLVGFSIFIISLLLSCYVLIAKYLGKTIPGWTSIILSLYILSGLIILFLGILGEYIGKIYMEVKQRPRFIVEEKIG
ncbi:MAG: glycosyltransferase [Candidatus Aenigmatarchaeota archaeon]|nr:MAG: glycosyltransferase [Candidatus Aenigmarchaeota archaeon]